MMGMRYTRAVPTRDCHAIVYAHRLTRRDAVGSLLDEEHFVLCICGETHIARIGSWIVWHPLSVEFDLLPDDSSTNVSPCTRTCRPMSVLWPIDTPAMMTGWTWKMTYRLVNVNKWS